MTDETLDRELEDLFAVDPSPAYLPAVRARIEVESRTPAPWRWTWLPALAAVTLLLLFVGIRPLPASDPAASGPAPVESTSASAPKPIVPTEAALIAGVAVTRPPQTRTSSRSRAARRAGVTSRSSTHDATRRPQPDPFADIQLSAAEQQLLSTLRESWRGVPMPEMSPIPRDADDHPVAVKAIAVPDVAVARLVIEPTALMARREEER